MADPQIPDAAVSAFHAAAALACTDCGGAEYAGCDEALRAGLAAAYPILAAQIRADLLRAVAQDLANEAAFRNPMGLADVDPAEITTTDQEVAEALMERARAYGQHADEVAHSYAVERGEARDG